MMNRPFFTLLIALLLGGFTVLFAGNVQAKDDLRVDVYALSKLPILHEGRIKPMDSFARALRSQLAGTERNAMPWLVEVLFDPVRAQSSPSIKITNPEILTLLNLSKSKTRLYSYDAVSEGLSPRMGMVRSILDADQEDWTSAQADLVGIYEKIAILNDLMSSFSGVLPMDLEMPEHVTSPELTPYIGKTISYWSLLAHRDALRAAVKAVAKIKGSDYSNYTEDEQILAQMTYTLAVLENTGRMNSLFRVVPQDDGEWLSLWQAIEDKPERIEPWANLAAAYHKGNADAWAAAVERLYTREIDGVRGEALEVEALYHAYNPFMIAMMCALIGFGFLIGGQFAPKRRDVLVRGAAVLLFGFVIAQICGIGMRMYILERPPVSTLYESVLFVTGVVGIYALIAYAKGRRMFWLWGGLGLGVVLQILGFSHQQDGDNFVMLSAVLNTNFWLATHVICITAGYGFCAVTSLIAHWALALRAMGQKVLVSDELFKNLQSAALFSLLFAGVGTILGGVWADQSWGRFWGWDPKENGALLIVLWLVWVIHGRISGRMRVDGYLFGLAFLSLIVALSWFGVNLLSVGLHAYGFTDKAAGGLAVFGVAEMLFLIYCFVKIKASTREVKHA